MASTQPASSSFVASSPGTSPKQRALRELNQEARDVQVALNQAQHSLDRAVKLMEETYHRKRQQIINAPYYES